MLLLRTLASWLGASPSAACTSVAHPCWPHRNQLQAQALRITLARVSTLLLLGFFLLATPVADAADSEAADKEGAHDATGRGVGGNRCPAAAKAGADELVKAGRVLIKDGRAGEARACFEKAVANNPRFLDIDRGTP